MQKIGHVHLKVSSLKKSENFYTKIFGLKITERVASYVFMTFGKKHHDLALQEHKNAEKPHEDAVGLYHFAIELDNLKELAEIYFKLKKLNVQFSPIDHGISKAIYLSDPDGIGIEVYTDTRNEKKDWEGMSRFIQEEEFLKWKK